MLQAWGIVLENHQRLVFAASSNRRASCGSGREGDAVAVYDRVAWRERARRAP